MTFSFFTKPVRIIPRAIAEPIFPAPITPIFSVNTGGLLGRLADAGQHSWSAREVQSPARLLKKPPACSRGLLVKADNSWPVASISRPSLAAPSTHPHRQG